MGSIYHLGVGMIVQLTSRAFGTLAHVSIS